MAETIVRTVVIGCCLVIADVLDDMHVESLLIRDAFDKRRFPFPGAPFTDTGLEKEARTVQI